ncbi:MAG: RNA-directed DNA polymerase [Bacteroidales bacterium]|nr:RNA-directed DNA polymerase [Bacteroidales bacterium]
MKPQNIFNLNHEEALEFLMNAECFYTYELPDYFDFNPVLKYAQEAIGNRTYKDCCIANPEECENVTLDVTQSKDGKYAIRPCVLANPYLYYFLAREICEEKNWNRILFCFEIFRVENSKSCAYPIIPEEEEDFHNSTSILNWWTNMEQHAIELSLEYKYMFVTDITNCYGTINPQAIDWALSMKDTEYATDENMSLAANIITYLRAMQNGRNIGIPQGSELFNVVAEIILGYSDLLLYNEIKKEGITCKYEILRYRDDYRIFCNEKDKLEQISYLLQKVLAKLNFTMNSKKTLLSSSIITDAMKPDKLAYIYNTPIVKTKGHVDENGKWQSETEYDFAGLQKHLMHILLFSREHPDSGTVTVMLSDFQKRINQKIKDYKDSEKKKKRGDTNSESIAQEFVDGDDNINYELKQNLEKQGIFLLKKDYLAIARKTISPLVAIATQIAVENVKITHHALGVISTLISVLRDDDKLKKELVRKVCNRLRGLPNSEYVQVWLQHITYQNDKLNDTSKYTMPLCKFVMGTLEGELWNNTWLNPEITSGMPYDEVCPEEKLKTMTPVIKIKKRYNYPY